MKRLLPILFLPLLAACGGNAGDSAKSMADYENASSADSLMYYFGQLRAVDYWREAKTDTTLATRESRDEFLRGVRAGIDAARNNDAYNQGLFTGIQLAMNLKEFQEGYELKVNRDIMVDAIADGLLNDSVVDPSEATAEFSHLISAFNSKKEEKDRAKGREALAAEARARKMSPLGDDLYAATPAKAGNGQNIAIGDVASISLKLNVVGGTTLDDANYDVKVGQQFVGPVTEALLSMKPGEKREFLTTPNALFGRVYERRGLSPADLIQITINVDSVSRAAAPTATVTPADAE